MSEYYVTNRYGRPIPSRDGHDYQDSATEPSLFDVNVEAGLQAGLGVDEPFILVAIGKLGSPNSNISGLPVVTTRRDISNANRSSGTYHEKLQGLFGTAIPFRHVSTFVIKTR